SNLRKKGFVYGKLNRKNERVVKKRKSTGAKELKDFVFIDIHFSAEKNILKSLQKNANFTINGFALPLEKVFSGDWYKSIISVKNAEKDIRNRQISVNAYIHPAQLYACVRFVSHGFKPPTEKEAEGPFHLLKKLRKNQLKRNLRKVFEQTGGKMKARKIAKRMGIKEDIFSLKVIKTL
ncbi:MAG: hypothetical protein KKD94_03330, partial [Nanoarchaeota archaeon]|nr:hypothetical protein [Nanoarchaeota archaeon]